jgi:hypothetical protein
VAPRVAWQSLDAQDNDPVRFLTHLVAAMRQVYQGAGEATLREAQAGAQRVVGPEVAVEGFNEDLYAVVARAQDIARQHGIVTQCDWPRLVLGGREPAAAHRPEW